MPGKILTCCDCGNQQREGRAELCHKCHHTLCLQCGAAPLPEEKEPKLKRFNVQGQNAELLWEWLIDPKTRLVQVYRAESAFIATTLAKASPEGALYRDYRAVPAMRSQQPKPAKKEEQRPGPDCPKCGTATMQVWSEKFGVWKLRLHKCPGIKSSVRHPAFEKDGFLTDAGEQFTEIVQNEIECLFIRARTRGIPARDAELIIAANAHFVANTAWAVRKCIKATGSIKGEQAAFVAMRKRRNKDSQTAGYYDLIRKGKDK